MPTTSARHLDHQLLFADVRRKLGRNYRAILAVRLGRTSETVRRIECGLKVPRSDELTAIAEEARLDVRRYFREIAK